MQVIEVLAGGPQTTVQDLGRSGYRASGVPGAGAMDRFALAAANLLVGNHPNAAGLEILLGGLRLRFLAPLVVSIAGADLGAELDGAACPLWATLHVSSNSILDFTVRRIGARAYLAIRGGFDVPPMLGSCSTYLPGGWGGFGGRPLRAGDRLQAAVSEAVRIVERWAPPERRPGYTSVPALRCVVGPDNAHFTADALRRFFDAPYRVSAAADRMGYRLEGPVLGTLGEGMLPSAGVLPGAIQVPAHGQPILLMADAQTTGGYPVIATVIGADLPLAAQLLPGDAIRFRSVSVDTATTAIRTSWRDLQAIMEETQIEGAPI